MTYYGFRHFVQKLFSALLLFTHAMLFKTNLVLNRNFNRLHFEGLWIRNRTNILYSQEAHITFWCPMRFELYPLDKQICQFPMASYAYGLEKVNQNLETLFFQFILKFLVRIFFVV
jgi:hypothetical protein